ncbi:MAG: PIN domain nuclease [Flavobacteriaceae bacterium]|nr:PIN domain nuclease [Flavobacteriaceae bacterium]
MIFVVDSNIIFSALLNPKSPVGEVLLDIHSEYEFYAPEFLLDEIEKYADKIEKYTRLSKEELKIIKYSVFSTIKFISENLILQSNWNKAFELLEDIDEKDTPFVALAFELDTKLWTGDKKLINGLQKKQIAITITTNELKK